MFNLERTLLEIIAELSKNEFDNACEKAGVNENVKKAIFDILDNRGV